MALPSISSESSPSGIWFKVMDAAMDFPGASVDRGGFLKSQLQPHCSDEEVSKAIAESPAKAGISSDLINRLADSCINNHATKAAAISFAAGLPGGWAMLATVPADLAQFFWHVIVLSQKLAYLYGWPSFLDSDGDLDEETLWKLTLFTGAMMGAELANRAISIGARHAALQAMIRIPRIPLTKYILYNMAKQVAKWLGVVLTKKTFAKGIAKAIPIVGGILSGGITFGVMKTMGGRLKSHLESLYFARGRFFR